MAKLLSNSKAVETFVVGFATGYTKKSDPQNPTKYVRLLVSDKKQGTSFSYFSLFGTPELLEQVNLGDNLQYPAKFGDKELRFALPNDKCVSLGEYILWSIEHCPIKLEDSADAAILTSVSGVSTPAAAEIDAQRALKLRYAQAVKMKPSPELVLKHRDYISADFVSPTEIADTLYGGLTWQEYLTKMTSIDEEED